MCAVFKATFCIASASADLVWISSAATAILGLQQHAVAAEKSGKKSVAFGLLPCEPSAADRNLLHFGLPLIEKKE